MWSKGDIKWEESDDRVKQEKALETNLSGGGWCEGNLRWGEENISWGEVMWGKATFGKAYSCKGRVRCVKN